MNVNESINNGCSECMILHLNIANWIPLSHSSKGENRTVEIAEKVESVNMP